MDEKWREAMERRPNGDLEFSWLNLRIGGQNIMPEVRDRGTEEETCVFEAFCAGAEQDLLRSLAEQDPPTTTDMRFRSRCLRLDYEEKRGRVLGKDRVKKGKGKVKQTIDTIREDTALHLFKYKGVEATSADWPEPRRVHIRDWRILRHWNFQRVFNYIRQGRPMMGTMPVGVEMHQLGPDEIYQFYPEGETYGRNPDYVHMVAFIGYGYAGPDERPYLVFLNSSGTGFGDRGFGRVYFDQIFNERIYTVMTEIPETLRNHSAGASSSTAASLQAPPQASTTPAEHQVSSSGSYPVDAATVPHPGQREEVDEFERPPQRRRLAGTGSPTNDPSSDHDPASDSN